MNTRLYLFSSALERDAAFPDGVPDGVLTDLTGVGLIAAGAGTAGSIQRHQPSEVVYLGTCGAYTRSNLIVGEIVVITDAVLGSGDVLSGDMRLPSLMKDAVETDRNLSGVLLAGGTSRGFGEKIHIGRAVCTHGVTETDALAMKLGTGFAGDVENLEVFAVLHAAGDVPAAAVLGVTNIVGAGGGRDWAANFRGIMRTLVRRFV